LDTLSLWKLGAAEVIGLDISERMLACAAAKSTALGAPARWIHADVLDAPRELDGTADWVYTGRGALFWLMDINAWAAVVQRLLKPGGKLYVFEGHPVAEFLFDQNADTLKLDADADYFRVAPISSKGWPATYVGDVLTGEQGQSPKHERPWKMSDIINAVIGAGLSIGRFEEHPDTFYESYPKLPDDIRRRFPNTFSLLAERPR
jgi:SAM-dependent methyltransferase